MIFWRDATAGPVVARVAVAGDFLPAGHLVLPRGGWEEAAGAVAPCFTDCQVSFANLECSLDAGGLPPHAPAGLGQTVSAPAESLAYLQALRCAVVGNANNHAFDFGRAGADRTRAVIAHAGFAALGFTLSLRQTPDVFVRQGPAGIRLGFWAAAIASRNLATRTSSGVEPATITRARDALRELHSRRATISIALLHAGVLRTSRPDPADADLMDQIARCGFTLVAASHSHRISGARALATDRAVPSFCFYGLGSIVSGFCADPLEREGLVVVAGLTAAGTLAQIEARPVLLAESGFGSAPAFPDAERIINRFRCLSDELRSGAASRLFYEEVRRGLFRLYARDIRAALRQSGLRGLASKLRRVRLRHFQRLVRALAP